MIKIWRRIKQGKNVYNIYNKGIKYVYKMYISIYNIL